MARFFAHWPRLPGPLALDERLYFLHIAKTGGTTLQAILGKQFAASDICPARGTEDLLAIPPEELRRYRLVSGHHELGFGLANYAGCPYWVLTMLRDPVDLAISKYHHLLQNPTDPFHALAKERWPTFEAFVFDNQVRRFHNNPQAHALGENELTWDVDLLRRAYQLPPDARSEVNQSVRKRRKLISAERLREFCRARLDACAFVGVHERFAESVELLSLAFGWPSVPEIPRLNTSRRLVSRADLSASVLARLAELTAVDRELHQYAHRLFEQRWNEAHHWLARASLYVTGLTRKWRRAA